MAGTSSPAQKSSRRSHPTRVRRDDIAPPPSSRTKAGLEAELGVVRAELSMVETSGERRRRRDLGYAQFLLGLVALLCLFYVFLLELKRRR